MGCCFTMLFSNVSELSMTQSSDSGLDSSELEFNSQMFRRNCGCQRQQCYILLPLHFNLNGKDTKKLLDINPIVLKSRTEFGSQALSTH